MLFAITIQDENNPQAYQFEDLDSCNKFAMGNAPCYVCEVVGMWQPVAGVEFVAMNAATGPEEPERPKRGRPAKKAESVADGSGQGRDLSQSDPNKRPVITVVEEYDPFADENDSGPGQGHTMDAEEFAIRRCAVPDDATKCPRCGGLTISALANKDKLTICKNEECYPGSEWLARQAQINASIPASIDAAAALKQTGFTIPDETEVSTRTRLLGMELDTPNAAWSETPITNESTTDNVDSRGQLVALNAGLTAIGYGDALRHAAVGKILCIDPPGSLRDLTKAQAHLALEWLSKAGPDHLAILAKAMTQRQEIVI